ncbi:MAG: heme-degrading domain-containing protein [Anaerolineales bacterium]
MDDKLKSLLLEEEELQFTMFNAEVAWQIGSELVTRAKSDNLPITVDITQGTHQLFHASRPGTSADNDEWVKRKVRLVYRFGHSSFYIGQLLKSKGKKIEEAYLISETEYAPHGGCFPVIIKGSGIIGTITVSGLAQEMDHQLVVDVVRNYLKRELN